MRRFTITEAKNNLSALLDSLKSRSPVLIVDRGRPVARLEPITTELQARRRRKNASPRSRRHGDATPRRAAGDVVQPAAAARQGRCLGCQSSDRRAPGGPVRFWDASAIVPLLVAKASTRRLQALAARDPDMLVWSGSEAECVSVPARLERDGALDPRAGCPCLRSTPAIGGLLA